MENITEVSGNNLGSVLGLWLIKASAVVSIPVPNTNYITSQILLNDQSQKSHISFIPETCGFSEKSKQTAHGRLWQKNIVFNVAKVSPEVNQWIYENSDQGLICILKDGNENINIIGDLDFPLRCDNIDASRGTKVSSRNEYDFSLECNHKYQSFFYMMFEPSPDGQRKIFDNTFDFTFE